MKEHAQASTDLDTIGVVIPAHNEELLIADCLTALRRAAGHPDLRRRSVVVKTIVVLDDCDDGTALRCAQHGVPTLAVAERNVGRARHAGAVRMIAAHGAGSPHRLWLAMTDADSLVAPDWLAEQVRFAAGGADAVFGVVDVVDWSSYSKGTPRLFDELYAGTRPCDRGQHDHVHGACLGVRADVYQRVGGIAGIHVGEDRAFSTALEACGDLRIARSTSVRVTTSARPRSRVAGGFASLLSSLEELAVSGAESAS